MISAFDSSKTALMEDSKETTINEDCKGITNLKVERVARPESTGSGLSAASAKPPFGPMAMVGFSVHGSGTLPSSLERRIDDLGSKRAIAKTGDLVVADDVE